MLLKRLALLWATVRGDARLLFRALRHPASPPWLKFGVAGIVLFMLSPAGTFPVIGLVDDVVLVPLAIRFLLNRLPAHLRADIGAGPRRA